MVMRVAEDFVKCRLSCDMRVEGSSEVREEERLRWAEQTGYAKALHTLEAACLQPKAAHSTSAGR